MNFNFNQIGITKTYILSKITEEQIFCKYLDISEIRFDTKYLNPLRKDESAGCKFYRNDKDTLYFKDFAWKTFDCFNVVEFKYGLSFPQALVKIFNDFNIKDSSIPKQQEIVVQKFKPLEYKIRVKRKQFIKEELKFWTPNESWKEKITTEKLQENKIFSISHLWEYVGDDYKYTTDLKNQFAYHFKDYDYQIYRPFLKERRFLVSQGLKLGDLEFLDIKASYVVITKSKKDAFFLRLCGVNACFILHERIKPKDIVEALKLLYYPDDIKIFTLLDNDTTGMRASINFRRLFKTQPLLIPKSIGKDFHNYCQKTSYYETINQISKLKQKYGITN